MNKIVIDRVSFHYENGQAVFNDLSFIVEKGEFVCLLGQSGCGKSTLLKLIAGLHKPTAGSILLDGEVVKKANLNMAVVFQDYGLFPWMSAGENISLAIRQKYKEMEKKRAKTIALDMMQRVDLEEEVYDKLPKELSGGMKQRCAIAQAFAIDAPVLLMDEPFGALDAVTRAKLQDLLIELWTADKEKKTIVFVTHDVEEALLLADKIVVLGQSADNNIIYSCKLERKEDRGRVNQFTDSGILTKRNELIEYIYQDVSSLRRKKQ